MKKVKNTVSKNVSRKQEIFQQKPIYFQKSQRREIQEIRDQRRDKTMARQKKELAVIRKETE